MVAHQEAHERANNFWRVALAETFKFFSLRSQRASFAVLIFLPPLVAGIRSWISPAQNHLATSKTIWALDTMAMTALPMGFLAAAVGLTVMASEYQNGALISTRLAEPSLRKLIWAKGIVAFFTAGLASTMGFGLATLVLAQNLSLDSFHLGIAQLLHLSLNAGLSCSLIALMAVGVASLSRSIVSAGLILAIVLAILPPLFAVAAGAGSFQVTDFFVSSGLQAATTLAGGHPFTLQGVWPSRLEPEVGLVVVGFWALGFLLVGGWFAHAEFVWFRSFAIKPARRRVLDERPAAPTNGTGYSFWRVTWAEIYKLLTIRGTWVFVALVIAAGLAQSLAVASSKTFEQINQGAEVDQATFQLDNFLFHAEVLSSGAGSLQLMFAFFGLFCFMSDKTTGAIISSQFASPSRINLWLAKVLAVVFFALALAVTAQVLISLVTISAELGGGWQLNVLSEPAMQTSWNNVLALTLCTLIGFSFAVLVPGAVAGYASILGLFVILPSLLTVQYSLSRSALSAWFFNLHNLVPDSPTAVRWSPQAQREPIDIEGGLIQLGSWQAMLVIAVWAFVLAGLSFFALRRGVYSR